MDIFNLRASLYRHAHYSALQAGENVRDGID